MSRVPPPFIECPKCGDPVGFAAARPSYRSAEMTGRDRLVEITGHDRLVWECSTCDYRVVTRTADAEPESTVPVTFTR